MKLVNWIFGSVFILLLIFILVEIADTPAFQNWWAGLNSGQTRVEASESNSVKEKNTSAPLYSSKNIPVSKDTSISKDTSAAKNNPGAKDSIALKGIAQNKASAIKQAEQQQIIHQPVAIQPRIPTRSTSSRITFTKALPLTNSTPLTNSAPKKSSSSKVDKPDIKQPEAPAIVYQTPYNARTLKSGPVVNAASSAADAVSRSEGYMSRKITQAEINEFMRQYPERSIKIRFAFYGTCDAEMENVKAQIINELTKNGYSSINTTWNPMSGYTPSDEVHFGPYGNSGAIIYIPPVRK